MGRIVVIGSANVDMVIHTAAMPTLGETRMGYGFQQNAGGKGLNQAVAIARLGGNVTFVGAVGQDRGGELLLSTLRENGVAFAGVQTAAYPTGVAMITVVGGDNSIVVNAGANAAMTPDVINACAPLIAQSDYCIVQLEIPLETVIAACKTAAAHGTKVVLNPAPYQPLPAQLLSLVDYCIPNEHEAAAMTGIAVADEACAVKAVNTMQESGIKHPIMTWGGNGCVYHHDGNAVHHPAARTDVIDTTSAGDCFIGALVTRLSEGEALPEAIAFATKAAAIAVSRKGAAKSIPHAWEVK